MSTDPVNTRNRSFRLLVNPDSAGRGAGVVVAIARLLRAAGALVEVTYSPGAAECGLLVDEAVTQGQVVVAVGGDGMVNSIAGRVIEAGGLLGIVRGGRGNDFARQLGLPQEPEGVARALLTAEPRPVDVIDVAGRVIVGSVYAGVDAVASEIVNRANRVPRRLQYPYAAVRALATFHPTTYHVVIDGIEHRHEACTVVIANSGYYGAGMHIAPTASVTDGELDIVIIAAASKARLIRSLPKLYAGTHPDLDEVLVLRGQQVRLSAEQPMTAYGDGERIGPLPVKATVRRHALQVLA